LFVPTVPRFDLSCTLYQAFVLGVILSSKNSKKKYKKLGQLGQLGQSQQPTITIRRGNGKMIKYFDCHFLSLSF
jgi:hypothetical protein